MRISRRHRLFRPCGGEFGGTVGAQRDAGGAQRAIGAARPAARAQRGAQVHQALGVGGDGGLIAIGQQVLRALPERAFDRRCVGPTFDTEMAREHALHIAVEDRGACAEGEGGDGRRGRAADAGQLREQVGVAREMAAVFGHQALRAGVQIARPAVIAKAAPQGEHFVDRGCGQGGEGRKTLEKARVIADHRGHLGLLEHDLRQPDAVRIAGVLPGQVVAAVGALPGDDAGGEVGRRDVAFRPRRRRSHRRSQAGWTRRRSGRAPGRARRHARPTRLRRHPAALAIRRSWRRVHCWLHARA